MTRATAVIAGCGNRGKDAYGFYALSKPENLKIVAIADPDPRKREAMGIAHAIPEDRRFSNWEEMVSMGKIADAAIISTMDRDHVGPAISFMDAGYDLLLEKPIDSTPEGTMKIVHKTRETGRKVMVAHVLRYSSFFSTLKQLIDSGRIGKLVAIEHKENIGFFHFAHSYVRGNWRKTSESGPVILTKSCHDLDILHWLAGNPCTSLSSYGSLTYFKAENQPDKAADRCLDGCSVEGECPYSAMKIYMSGNTGWPVSTITSDLTEEGVETAVKRGPYGRCVFSCDNDVADHQVVSMLFGEDITVNFLLAGFTEEIARTIRVFGTEGEIRGHFEKRELQIMNFGKDKETIITHAPVAGSHGGADFQMMDFLIDMIDETRNTDILTTPEDSIESHMMAFAAEESRDTLKIIDMDEFRQRHILFH